MVRQVEENDLTYLKGLHFNFGIYVGQARCLRKVAIEIFGEEVVAGLTDQEVKKKIIDLDFVPVVIKTNNGVDEDNIYLIKKDILSFSKRLFR